MVDVIRNNFVPTETSALPVSTVDTHNVVDTHRPLLGVDEQLRLTAGTVVPLGEDLLEDIVGIDLTISLDDEAGGEFGRVDDMDEVVGHNGGVIHCGN